MDINALTAEVIGCAIEVHKVCGPGLLENVYKQCLIFELQKAGHEVEAEKPVKFTYKDSGIDLEYKIDILVDKLVIIELKSVSALNS